VLVLAEEAVPAFAGCRQAQSLDVVLLPGVLVVGRVAPDPDLGDHLDASEQTICLVRLEVREVVAGKELLELPLRPTDRPLPEGVVQTHRNVTRPLLPLDVDTEEEREHRVAGRLRTAVLDAVDGRVVAPCRDGLEGGLIRDVCEIEDVRQLILARLVVLCVLLLAERLLVRILVLRCLLRRRGLELLLGRLRSLGWVAAELLGRLRHWC